MVFKDYIKEVKKQQTFIKKLTTNRKERFNEIERLTNEMYGPLEGRFFVGDGEVLSRSSNGEIYLIDSVSLSDDVLDEGKFSICMAVKFLGKTSYCGTGDNWYNVGLDRRYTYFYFKMDTDIYEKLSSLFISSDDAIKEIDSQINNFRDFFLMTEKERKEA